MANPAEMAAKKLAWNMESWKSIELRLREDFEKMAPTQGPDDVRTFRGDFHYIETAAGQRLSEEPTTADGGDRTLVSIHYSDGARSALLVRVDQGGVPGPEQVSIHRAFGKEDEGGMSHRPEPLRAFYAGLVPLSKALPKANYLGEGRQLGRACDRFHFAGVAGSPGLNLVYWIDRETAAPLRLEYYADATAYSEGRTTSAWIAESLDEVGGHHLSLKSELVMYQFKGPDPRQVGSRYKIAVQEVAFDRDYPRAMFWPKITGETTVVDMVKGKIDMPQSSARTTTAAPIRAVEPGDWKPSISTVAIIAGSTLLASGLVLRWRRR